MPIVRYRNKQKCIVIVAGEAASEHNMAMARAETKIFVGKSNLPRNGLRTRNRKEQQAQRAKRSKKDEKICFRTIHGHNPKYQ